MYVFVGSSTLVLTADFQRDRQRPDVGLKLRWVSVASCAVSDRSNTIGRLDGVRVNHKSDGKNASFSGTKIPEYVSCTELAIQNQRRL